jgi:hypothetical protein
MRSGSGASQGRALPMACATVAASASVTVPTGRPVAGSRTSRGVPVASPWARIGAASQVVSRKGARAESRRARVKAVAEVAAAGVPALGQEELGAGGDASRRDRVEGVADDLLGGDALVHDTVHEGGVGAVLEEAADEVGQEVAVRADGGVDAKARALLGADDLVQSLAHAVKALELEPLLRHAPPRGHAAGRRPRCGRCGWRTAGRCGRSCEERSRARRGSSGRWRACR